MEHKLLFLERGLQYLHVYQNCRLTHKQAYMNVEKVTGCATITIIFIQLLCK
jgi:hypothetical protein